MVDHVRVVAVLNFVWGALAVIGGIQFFLFVDTAPTWMVAIASFFILLGVPAAVAGIGLLQKRRWGRTFAHLTAGLSLVSIPIGTAFGVYSFVVLRKPEVEATLR